MLQDLDWLFFNHVQSFLDQTKYQSQGDPLPDYVPSPLLIRETFMVQGFLRNFTQTPPYRPRWYGM